MQFSSVCHLNYLVCSFKTLQLSVTQEQPFASSSQIGLQNRPTIISGKAVLMELLLVILFLLNKVWSAHCLWRILIVFDSKLKLCVFHSMDWMKLYCLSFFNDDICGIAVMMSSATQTPVFSRPADCLQEFNKLNAIHDILNQALELKNNLNQKQKWKKGGRPHKLKRS